MKYEAIDDDIYLKRLEICKESFEKKWACEIFIKIDKRLSKFYSRFLKKIR